jgi:hypothetical protein
MNTTLDETTISHINRSRVVHAFEREEIVMATRVPDGVSIRVVVDVADSICAALESDPETVALAASWAPMRDKADGLANARRDSDRATIRARAQLAVCDAKWDATVAAFGRAVVDASAGRRDQPPYTRFFSKAKPSATQRFGIEREIEVARAWLVELARDPTEPLAQAWAPKVKEVTDELETAFKQRNATVTALGPLQTSVVLLIDDLNRELVRLEGDLKKLFPSEPDRVASYLAATRRPSSNENAGPAPVPSPTLSAS